MISIKKLVSVFLTLDMRLILSIGIGVIVIILASICFTLMDGKGKKSFSYLNGMEGTLNKFKRKLKRKFENNKSIILNDKEKYLIMISAVLVVTASNNLKSAPKYLGYGLILGLIIVLLFQKVKKDNLHTKKVEEFAIVFEAIELYMRAGYSMYQAIRTSRLLVKEIRPSIDMCLTYWGAGPKNALSKFQEDLNLPEAETLILLLINLESTGSKEMRSAIGGEVFSIESIERMKTNIKTSNKPLVLMVYRMLPLGSVLGIVVGSLIYRTFAVLGGSGITLF